MAKGMGREHTRRKVRERDNWTCQDCGFRRTPDEVKNYNEKRDGLKGKMKSLDVHHLHGQCGKNSVGYDRVSEMPNLITLCHQCHYHRHDNSQVLAGKYGRTNFIDATGAKIPNLIAKYQQGYEMKYLRARFLMSEDKIRTILVENGFATKQEIQG